MLLPIRVELNGLLKVMSLPVSPSLGVWVGLKDLARVILLSSSVLKPILFSATHSLAYAQGLKDLDIYHPFWVINTPISRLLFTFSTLFLVFGFVVTEPTTPVELFIAYKTFFFSFNG
jgi:hypothetical protein